MNTRDKASEYRLSHWAGEMHERQESGLNIKSYCRNAGIHENVYYYWQRKLREAAVEHAGLAQASENRLVPTGWTRLEPNAVGHAEAGISIEVGGWRITATAETDTELLAKVCRMLKTL